MNESACVQFVASFMKWPENSELFPKPHWSRQALTNVYIVNMSLFIRLKKKYRYCHGKHVPMAKLKKKKKKKHTAKQLYMLQWNPLNYKLGSLQKLYLVLWNSKMLTDRLREEEGEEGRLVFLADNWLFSAWEVSKPVNCLLGVLYL